MLQDLMSVPSPLLLLGIAKLFSLLMSIQILGAQYLKNAEYINYAIHLGTHLQDTVAKQYHGNFEG